MPPHQTIVYNAESSYCGADPVHLHNEPYSHNHTSTSPDPPPFAPSLPALLSALSSPLLGLDTMVADCYLSPEPAQPLSAEERLAKPIATKLLLPPGPPPPMLPIAITAFWASLPAAPHPASVTRALHLPALLALAPRAAVLQPGDIIAVRSVGPAYTAVRGLTSHRFDHVGLYLSHSLFLHVSPPLARVLPVHLLLDPRRRPVVLRPTLTHAQRARVAHAFTTLAGRRYSSRRLWRAVHPLVMRRAIARAEAAAAHAVQAEATHHSATPGTCGSPAPPPGGAPCAAAGQRVPPLHADALGGARALADELICTDAAMGVLCGEAGWGARLQQCVAECMAWRGCPVGECARECAAGGQVAAPLAAAVPSPAAAGCSCAVQVPARFDYRWSGHWSIHDLLALAGHAHLADEAAGGGQKQPWSPASRAPRAVASRAPRVAEADAAPNSLSAADLAFLHRLPAAPAAPAPPPPRPQPLFRVVPLPPPLGIARAARVLQRVCAACRRRCTVCQARARGADGAGAAGVGAAHVDGEGTGTTTPAAGMASANVRCACRDVFMSVLSTLPGVPPLAALGEPGLDTALATYLRRIAAVGAVGPGERAPAADSTLRGAVPIRRPRPEQHSGGCPAQTGTRSHTEPLHVAAVHRCAHASFAAECAAAVAAGETGESAYSLATSALEGLARAGAAAGGALGSRAGGSVTTPPVVTSTIDRARRLVHRLAGGLMQKNPVPGACAVATQVTAPAGPAGTADADEQLADEFAASLLSLSSLAEAGEEEVRPTNAPDGPGGIWLRAQCTASTGSAPAPLTGSVAAAPEGSAAAQWLATLPAGLYARVQWLLALGSRAPRGACHTQSQPTVAPSSANTDGRAACQAADQGLGTGVYSSELTGLRKYVAALLARVGARTALRAWLLLRPIARIYLLALLLQRRYPWVAVLRGPTARMVVYLVLLLAAGALPLADGEGAEAEGGAQSAGALGVYGALTRLRARARLSSMNAPRTSPLSPALSARVEAAFHGVVSRALQPSHALATATEPTSATDTRPSAARIAAQAVVAAARDLLGIDWAVDQARCVGARAIQSLGQWGDCIQPAAAAAARTGTRVGAACAAVWEDTVTHVLGPAPSGGVCVECSGVTVTVAQAGHHNRAPSWLRQVGHEMRTGTRMNIAIDTDEVITLPTSEAARLPSTWRHSDGQRAHDRPFRALL